MVQRYEVYLKLPNIFAFFVIIMSIFYSLVVPQVKGGGTVHVMLVVFFQPLGEYLAILLVSIDKASVARVAEQMPLAVGNMLVE